MTPYDVADVRVPGMWLDVNGTRMRTGPTAKMIFDTAFIAAYMSEFVQLEPGNLICTGTPPRVGQGIKPAGYLPVGDSVTLSITGLGAGHQTVVAFDPAKRNS